MAMLLSAPRQDLERQHACTGREMLFKHGGMGQAPVSCYASLKSLTDGEHALQMASMVLASGDADNKGFRWQTWPCCSSSIGAAAAQGGELPLDR